MSDDTTLDLSKPTLNPLTHYRDGRARHPSTVAVLKHFRYVHLPERLQAISAPCCALAVSAADKLPEGPELTVGLRKLLEAKDCLVRASFDEPAPLPSDHYAQAPAA